MIVATGYYNTRRNPCIRLHLEGAFNRSTAQLGDQSEALIDTGFDGFISMPMKEAFCLAVPLNGWVFSKLADGSTHKKTAAWVRAILTAKEAWGEAILEPDSNEILVGLEFMRTFQLALVLTASNVLLFNDDDEWPRELSEMKEPRGVGEQPPAPYGSGASLQ
jgi:predicted aspartyl protease